MEANLTKEEIIENIKGLLSRELRKEDGFDIASEIKWGPSSSKKVLDLVVRNNDYLLAVFSVVLSKEPDEMDKFLFRFNGIYDLTKTPFLILYCDDNKTYFMFYTSKTLHYLKNYSNLFLENYERCRDIKVVIRIIKQLSDYYYSNRKKNHNNLVFNKYDEKVLDPEWCRERLGIFQGDKICRYTSLDSLFSTLLFKTIRMNGLPGMNDRKEGLFAWNLIYSPENKDNSEYLRRMRLINDAFIVSYSSEDLIDNLTQWRLYGDDAKGVCCVYSVKDRLKDSRFFLHEVRYIKEKETKELIESGNIEQISDELLKSFLKYQENYPSMSYFDLSPAIFFYKPDAFESENEIRLLFDNKESSAYTTDNNERKWVLTNANNIPNPCIDIPLDEVPIILERIILGPNMNDVDTIQAQLETLLEQQGIQAKVELSKIDSYRNPTK